MTWQILINTLDQSPLARTTVKILGLFLLSYLVYFISKILVRQWLKFSQKKGSQPWKNQVMEKIVLKKLIFIPTLLMLHQMAFILPGWETGIRRAIFALVFWLILSTTGSLLSIANSRYEEKHQFKGRPIKGYLQVLTLVIYILGGLILISILVDQSPWILLSSIGALTAVLILIFRDTILSFAASIRITTNDLVRLNDRIEAPKFDADGDVVDIALHTIKIQNGDKSISIIPTHKLLDESFKNWRGMQEAGVRRIKRVLIIDVSSITFSNLQLLKNLEGTDLIHDMIKAGRKRSADGETGANFNAVEIDGLPMTNLELFQLYAERFLKKQPWLDLSLPAIVRQLSPSSNGLPVEILAYATITDLSQFEAIQTRLFSHLLAKIPMFSLRHFQSAHTPDA